MENGEFSAKAVQWDFGVGEKNDFIAVECEFLDGPNKGMSLTWRGMFSDDESGDPPKTRSEWTLIDLKKMGWDGKDLATLDGMGSKNFRVVVEPDDKKKPQIRRIYSAGGLAIKQRMSAEARRALADRVMSGKPAPQRTASHPNAPGNNDDIPF